MATPGLRVRTARVEDAAACARVHHGSWRETYADLLPGAHWETDTVERRVELWDRWLRDGVRAMVAEVPADAGQEVVGVAVAGAARERGGFVPARERELHLLYVLAARHGIGAGHALLQAVLPDDEPAQLWVADPNPRARRFYERHGFVADGARFVDDDGIADVRLIRPGVVTRPG